MAIVGQFMQLSLSSHFVVILNVEIFRVIVVSLGMERLNDGKQTVRHHETVGETEVLNTFDVG